VSEDLAILCGLTKSNPTDSAGSNSLIDMQSALFVFPPVFKNEWERHVLASKGYLELGMFGDAVQALEQISAEDKTHKEVLYAVLVNLAARNWDIAVPMAADLVKAEPENPIPWLLLASAVRHVGNVEQVEIVLLKARAWLPRDPLILFKLACCASATGRIEEAKLHLGHAIDLDENVQGWALDDEDLRSLWDWITEAP
jgi:tetratricopeptide (TPR) repeat protein